MNPTRRVGSKGNRAATHCVAEVTVSRDFPVKTLPLDCFDRREDVVDLMMNSEFFEALANPYPSGWEMQLPLCVVSTRT